MTGILEKGEWLPIVWFLSLVDFGYDGTEEGILHTGKYSETKMSWCIYWERSRPALRPNGV